MSYALATLWHERQRYLPGVMAVTFSAMLSALQCGLLWGILTITSVPVDATSADIWVGSWDVLSLDKGQPVPASFANRLSEIPEIEPASVEPFIQAYAKWKTKLGKSEMCIIVGSKLEANSCGRAEALTHEMCEKLTEPMTVVVDRNEFPRLGFSDIYEGKINPDGPSPPEEVRKQYEQLGLLDKKGRPMTDLHGEINGIRVKVVGTVLGYKAIAGPYILCSLQTARSLLKLRSDQTVYILARCKDGSMAEQVVETIRKKYSPPANEDPNAGEEKKDQYMSAFTAREFSNRTQKHWLFQTKAGLVIGYAAILGLFVGAVITSQTLFAATVASLRELAILRALGIPRWRMASAVLTQSFWVGILGVALSFPIIYVMSAGADLIGVKVKLENWLLGGVAMITLATAMLAGLFALRSLRQIEPASLLR